MPTLPNARQEKFAGLVAAGKPAVQAYVEAGYKPHPANPSRMRENERVAARIDELVAKPQKRPNSPSTR